MKILDTIAVLELAKCYKVVSRENYKIVVNYWPVNCTKFLYFVITKIWWICFYFQKKLILFFFWFSIFLLFASSSFRHTFPSNFFDDCRCLRINSCGQNIAQTHVACQINNSEYKNHHFIKNFCYKFNLLNFTS